MTRPIIIAAVCIPFLAGCSGNFITVEVINPLDCDRHTEMVEISLDEVSERLSLEDGDAFLIKDRENNEIPYQTTYDGQVVFPVTMKALQTSEFRIRKGEPAEQTVKACGRQYPDKDDDLAWENDLVGFRVYGHDLDVASGYDLFAKRGTDLPVLESFYANEVYGSRAWARYNELAATDEAAAFRFKMDTLSYHVDRGHGMDCYGVGPTLGAGVAALFHEGQIIYPYCYDTYEILDNGPLRFSVRLTFRPMTAGNDGNVVETRVITLDAGSHFNRTQVSYANLGSVSEIVTGIVLQDMDGNERADASKGFVTYPAPTINVDTTREVDNGRLFVANVFPSEVQNAGTRYFSEKESMERGGTKGHVLAVSRYNPGSVFTYYWGFGWNHADISTYEEWNEHVGTFAAMTRNPLIINLK